jgi:alkyl sulfatase BDS1-like metallo-beta-lactamase superfamily hydrolase
VFTHSHIDHFGGVLGVISPEEVAARQVPIFAPVGFLDEATSENVLMGPAMGRRSMYMYGSHLPRSASGLVDDGLGKAVAYGTVGILPPTITIDRTPQEEMIDGVRFVFQNVPGSEAPAELTFFLPDRKAYCGAEMVSHTMHNLYTLRGAKVRNAQKWAGYIDDALAHAADAEVYFGSHHWPVWGKERIHEFLIKQRDVYSYTHDQTIRMMNAGMTAQEIADQIRLPKALDSFLDVHGYYGTLKHNAKAMYQYYLGWFDANPAHLDPLPEKESARKYVELAGGVEKVLDAAQAAFDLGDYRWTAELLNHVVFADPGNQRAKELLARTYDQLGYAAESAPWRNFYLTGADELRNGRPQQGVSRSSVYDMLLHTPVERFLEAMAAALNGPRAEDAHLKVNLVFPDLHESYVLEIQDAVLQHHKAPPATDANATLTLPKPMFLRMMTGQAGIGDFLLNKEIQVAGSRVDLLRFLGLFDRAPGNFAIVTPE